MRKPLYGGRKEHRTVAMGRTRVGVQWERIEGARTALASSDDPWGLPSAAEGGGRGARSDRLHLLLPSLPGGPAPQRASWACPLGAAECR